MGAGRAVMGRMARTRVWWGELDGAQHRALLAMAAVVLLLHVVGFITLVLLVAPRHYELGSAGAFTVGIGVTAYTLGLRHAFDADHISAIDNTTRKLMSEGKRPLSVGFWFSLGHSSVVFGLGVGLTFAARAIISQVSNTNSTVETFGGIIGTLVS